MRIGFRDQGSGTRDQKLGGQGAFLLRRGWCSWLLVLTMGLGFFAQTALAEKPRVIALAPHLAELVFAAGAGETLVATVVWSDYPEAAAALPRIGDAFRLDLERIVGLDVDIALAWEGGTPPAAAERLAALGIEVIWIRTRSLAEIGNALIELGERLGQPEHGQAAAADFQAALQSRPAASADSLIPTFYQVSERPLFTLGGRHIINEILTRCGARNVFADLDVTASAVDREAVLARQPRLILAGQDGSQVDPLALWQRDRDALPEDLRLLEVDPDILIRPTPRIVAGIDQLCAALASSGH